MDDNLLSDREIEVLHLVGQGKSNKEIAVDLNISVNTVKVHIGRIFQKINVTSRTEATLYAIEKGIIKSPGNQIPHVGPDITSILDADPARRKTTKQNILLFFAIGLMIAAGLFVIISKPAFLFPRQTRAEIPQQKWVNMASMKVPRSNMAVVSYDGKIIIIGGHSIDGALSSVEVYDPNTNTWSFLKEKPTAVYDVSAAVIGERIIIPGGVTLDGSLTRVVEAFNPRKNEWEACTDLPIAVSGYGLATYEGQVYLFGGRDANKPLNSVWRYDPITDTWHEGSPMPTARYHSAVIADSGKILVMGGSDGQKKLNTYESYSPFTELENENPWKTEADLPERLSGYTAIKLNDIVAVIGDKSSSSGAIDLFHYSILQNEWQIINVNSESTNAISEAAYILLGNYIYVIGGKVGEEYQNHVSRYQAVYTILLPLTIN